MYMQGQDNCIYISRLLIFFIIFLRFHLEEGKRLPIVSSRIITVQPATEIGSVIFYPLTRLPMRIKYTLFLFRLPALTLPQTWAVVSTLTHRGIMIQVTITSINNGSYCKKIFSFQDKNITCT